MPELSGKVYALEFIHIFQRFFYLKPHLLRLLPNDLALLTERLDEDYLEDKVSSSVDYQLFYHIGVILSREEEPVTMGELSRSLGVPLSTATRIVDWLVDNQYASRLQDPDDRRIIRVALTEAGRNIYQAINDFLLERIERLMRQFTEDEQRSLLRLLHKMINLMDQED
jgi:DNA-binding MarR family transcriptional regulator